VELIRGLHNLREGHRGCVLTIGNFDGVHLGHQAIVAQLAALGGALGLPSVLMTFEPQPQEFFLGVRAPPRLTRLREKMRALAALPLERVLVVRFHAAFAGLAPERFIADLLVGRLGARRVVVGGDFRFGRGGAGNVPLLRAAGERFGFEVVHQETVRRGERRVSSSWVRECLGAGDLAGARRLLGRPYSMCGRVVRGDRLGRTLGYPTANIRLQRRLTPLSGVFAVQVAGVGERPWPGVASLGQRPTVGGKDWRLEVHLFDFERELYGRRLRVEFLHKLRDEVRFDSLEALRAQMVRDEAQAKDMLLGGGDRA